MQIRGFHLNFEAYRRMDMTQALRLIALAAQSGLNTLLVEYGPRFPFASAPELRAPDAMSTGDVATLQRAASDAGLTLIPLQQSIAHLEYILRCERFVRLRERPERDNLLCPADSESTALIKLLLTEIITAHAASPMIHLGGDEARKFGTCPRCAPLVRSGGIGSVFGRYMADLANAVIAHGKRPIVWDDTFCAHPDALDQLPKQTIINYWDYIAVADPSPVLIPRMSHALGGPRVVHHWRWNLRRKKGVLSSVQIGVMKNYSRPGRVFSALGDAYLAEFGPYLGVDLPMWFKALPYLEYYQARGFDVITSPTGMGNGDMADGTPNYARFEANIRTHAMRCRENARALGLITTAWYNMPPESLDPSIRQTGEQCTAAH